MVGGDQCKNASELYPNVEMVQSEKRPVPEEKLGSFDLASSPINVSALQNVLVSLNYNTVEAEFLYKGFCEGFSLEYSGRREAREAKNLKSVYEHPDIVQSKIDKEVLLGRVAGPFKERPIVSLRVSPIGLTPKKVPGEFRMIHHLSYPEGDSVNDHIDKNLCSVQYTSFDEAVFMLQDLGQNCKLFKMDIKNAFRLLPINPQDFELLGFKYDGKYYFDKCLPFGCSISCAHFERFSSFLEYYVKQKAMSGKLIHYLDDFLGGDQSVVQCEDLMRIFKDCFQVLNVPLADEKSEGPTEVLVFLGLELDSRKMIIRIPKEKLSEVLVKIREMLNKKTTKLKDMQSLIGSLNFCCRAIAVGRPFCRRLIDSICGLKKHHHLRVNKGIKLDLNMWLTLLTMHNGVSAFHDRHWIENDVLQLFTDSAGGAGLGFGIYFRDQWANATWPEHWHEKGYTRDITLLEMFPILVAVYIWGKELVNKRICFNCDNMAVVHILNKMSCKSTQVMILVRALAIKCLEFNIILKAKHVPGAKNVICDALSRLQLTRFRELAPNADLEPQIVPPHLWNICDKERSV